MVLTSIPKSGTHWVRNMLIPGAPFLSFSFTTKRAAARIRDEKHVVGHFVPRGKILEAAQETDTLFLSRDPKDTLTSWYHHCVERSVIKSPFLPYKRDEFIHADDKLLFLIQNLKPFFDEMHQWKSYVTHIKYDDIKKDVSVMKPICKQFGIGYGGVVARYEKKVKRYRTGTTGEWEKLFKPHHLDAFNELWL